MTDQKKNIFILGTDTGAGKTILSLLLMRYFHDSGRKPFYIKPFQTGCGHPDAPDSDARFIYSHLSFLQGKKPSDSVLYCLKAPKAPAFAAREEGITIEPEKVLSFIAEKRLSHAPVIIEAAGGIMVPVNTTHLIIDIVKAADAHPVVAARAGLGTINHSLLTLSSLKQEGFSNPTLFFIDKDRTDPDMIRENIEAVKRHSGIDVSGVIGPIADFSKPGEQVMTVISKAMETSCF